MHLMESGEMYLETILQLQQKQGNVRSVDISEYMGYSKPSISRAMGLLKTEGYILIDKDGYITLTREGAEVAQKIGAIMGVEVEERVRMRAQVMCSGTSEFAKKKYAYAGAKDCISATKLAGGDKLCPNGCIGLGTCVASCPFGAISVVNGVAVVPFSSWGLRI